MTLSTMTLYAHAECRYAVVILNIIMLNVVAPFFDQKTQTCSVVTQSKTRPSPNKEQCRYAECHFAYCRGARSVLSLYNIPILILINRMIFSQQKLLDRFK
jgi:hypothetical protein